jgi:penicillin-binding protein-related factor A (putative recombinase)
VATANRGKVAEGLVRKHLASVNRQDFAWSRLPDAHAGSFQPALADFLLLNAGQMILLEVKETQHDYRLPVGNFSPDSRARMRLFQFAGAKCQVLIFHSGIKLWRTAELDYFGTQTTGSWDMRELPLLTLREALC